MKILFVGDIVGKPGRTAFKNILSQMRGAGEGPDLVIVNGENSAGGSGITRQCMKELYDSGAGVITLGNHVWDKKEAESLLEEEKRLIRPANLPDECPGSGYCIVKAKDGTKVAVMNLSGRISLDGLNPSCPFKAANRMLTDIKKHTNIIIVDMHGEATSEKVALGWYLDGRVSAVLGTHTHVQTADERILPCGTGYLTDAGMTGPADGIIGTDRDIVLRRMLTGMHERFEVAKGDAQFNGVLMDIETEKGRCLGIERIYKVIPEA